MERLSIVLRLAAISSLLLLSTLGLSAADVYVRSDATGSNNGADWANALTLLPGQLVRGNTYYVARGTYGAQYISTSTASQTPVLIKKATVADHGTSVGWNDSYATGQAVWQANNNPSPVAMNITTGWIEWDGATGTGSSGHGFRFIGTSTADDGAVKINNGATAHGLRFKHIMFEGPGSGQYKIFYNGANYSTNYFFEDCYFYKGGQTWMTLGNGNGHVINRCFFEWCGSGVDGQHSTGIAGAANTEFTIKNSVFKNMKKGSSTCYIEPQGVGSNWYLFNNLFREDQPWAGTTQGAIAITSQDICNGLRFFNNTIYGLNSTIEGVYGGNVAGSTVYVTNNVWQACVNNPVFSGTDNRAGNNILNTGEVQFQNAAGGDFSLAANTSNGSTLSAPYDVDAAGTARVPGSWSKGAYQFAGSVGNPGTLQIAISPLEVSEAAGSVNVSVSRLGGTFGAISCAFGQQDGTAHAPANYTLTTGTLNWADGDGTTKTFTIPISNTHTYGNLTFTASITSPTGGATIGGPSSTLITITGTGSPPVTILPWPGIWEAESGQIAPPFIVSGGYVYQTNTTSVANGGSAIYAFVCPAGLYQVRVLGIAPELYQNSYGVNFNTFPPTEPDQVCQFIPPTATPVWMLVSWQGASGTAEVPQFKDVVWSLPAGTNYLGVYGREALTKMDKIEIVSVTLSPPTIVSISTTATNGFYKAGAVISCKVVTSEAVNVTGTPRVLLNNGGYANYASGSGTTNLTFSYTVAGGQNTSNLDNASTNSLQLNGGTIKNAGGTDMTLTLAAPGTSGALGFGRQVVIDTTRPTVTLGSPSGQIVRIGASVTIPVTYSDTYFLSSNLTSSDINVLGPDSISGTVSISGNGDQRFVTISGITGSGTFWVTVNQNTAFDTAGNGSTASAQSDTVTVINSSTLRSIMFRAKEVNVR